jgi:hypothetical protein
VYPEQAHDEDPVTCPHVPPSELDLRELVAGAHAPSSRPLATEAPFALHATLNLRCGAGLPMSPRRL